jgi:Carboxypeptidase regulatory-like domain/TonB-dependent Receptor Plug Domain/TonB dependent receptor
VTRLGSALFLFLAGSAFVFAQATASITGRVVDPADAVVPNATVTVTNLATSVSRDAVTNAEGLYTVPALTPGNYGVKVQIQGFDTAQRNNVVLETGATLSVDFKMQVGTVQQTVEVGATAALVETTQSIGTSTIQQAEVDELPMVNRSLSSLMTLMPGAREVATAQASRNAVSVAGGVGLNFNTLVDGLDNTENHNGGTMMTFSLEGIQEFRTLTTGASAEYGRDVAQVLLTTKSGTNQIHGSGFGYYRNQDFERTDYFSDPAHGGLGKPPLTHEQYGGSVGGPIIKDKLFFFGSLERTQQTFSIPISSAIQAQFQDLLFLNNAVGYSHNYIVAESSDSTPQTDLLAEGKINYNLNAKNFMFLRYSSETGVAHYQASSQNTTALLAPFTYQNSNTQKLFAAALGETFVINPTTVNQFNAGWSEYSHDTHYNTCPQSFPTLGVNSCLGDYLSFTNGVSTSFLGSFPDYTNWEHKWNFRDDVSKQMGRHALKFGVNYNYIPMFGGLLAVFGPGTISFNKSPSQILALPQGFQTPGIVAQISEWSGVNGDYSTPTSWQFAAFAQDDFKLTPRVTLNLGLRYDVSNLGFDSKADQALNPTYQILKAIGSPYGALPPIPNEKNFQPRLGVAWDVGGNGKNVVRVSFGLFYLQQLKIANYNQDVLQKPNPFVDSITGFAQLTTFVFGVTPLPPIIAAPTGFSPGNSSTGYWYDPFNMKDGATQQYHAGWSHVFGDNKDVLSVDYTYILLRHGLRGIDINPLINGVRVLSAATQRVYGDPKLLGPVVLDSSQQRAVYSETAAHFEHRFSARSAFQLNYILSWSNGSEGSGDGGLSLGAGVAGGLFPQIPSATGGLISAPWEYGPTAVDERNRITATGIFNLPFKIELAPSLTWATARPYTLITGLNPDGAGTLRVVGANGNPIGIGTQRGSALFDVNARVTRIFPFGKDGRYKVAAFAELYNITDRANFGNVYGGTVGSSTFEKPTGYLGGSGATSNIPVSFQVQFGGRFSF